jgi:hypothetical protein
MVRSLVFLILALLSAPAQAADQTYKVYLGGMELGWLRYSGTLNNARLTSLFDRTPLGVFDGTYEGSSRARSGGAIYRGKSVSTNKNREVEIISDRSGQVTQTTITPDKDRTELSIPAAVPRGVLDPVAGFGQFLQQKSGCPKAFKLYDGRRVVQVAPKAATSGAVTSCVMDYSVILGKGHLSPLYIKHITITMEYDPAIATVGPSVMKLRSGIFGVEFRRD